MYTQLRFTPIGFGHAVCANKVYMVINPKTTQSKRIVRLAKQEGRFLTANQRRAVKSILLMDDGQVIGTPFHPTTMITRLIRSTSADFIYPATKADRDDIEDEDEEEEDE